MYSQPVLTLTSRLDVMNRLGRAMADPTRSRILLTLLDAPGYPAELARDLELTRTNVSNHLTCLRGCGLIVATPEGRRTRIVSTVKRSREGGDWGPFGPQGPGIPDI